MGGMNLVWQSEKKKKRVREKTKKDIFFKRFKCVNSNKEIWASNNVLL